MTKTRTTRSVKAAKAANPTGRKEQTRSAAGEAPKAKPRKPLTDAEDFWALFTPSQKEFLLSWRGPDVHGPRKKTKRRG
jgi:hypothetical protein